MLSGHSETFQILITEIKLIFNYSGCTWEVWRALKNLECSQLSSRATFTLFPCSHNFPHAVIYNLTCFSSIRYNLKCISSIRYNLTCFSAIYNLKYFSSIRYNLTCFSSMHQTQYHMFFGT